MTAGTRAGLATNYTAMAAYGVAAILVGPTLPGMISEFDLTLAQAGLVGSLQNAGGFLGVMLTLRLADRVSRPWSAIASFAMLGAAYLWVGWAQTYVSLLLAIAATGLFIRILDVMLNVHTGALSQTSNGRDMNLLHMFFSIGAFVGPLAARAVMNAGADWSQVFLIVGGLYLGMLGIGSFWLRGYVASQPAGESKVEPGPLHPQTLAGAGSVPLVLAGGVLLFYAVHQIGVTAWIPHFLESERGAAADMASIGLSAYWVGIIFGRLVAASVVARIGANRLLVLGCLTSSLLTIAGATVPWVVIAVLAFSLAGLTSGATIPLVYTEVYRWNPLRRGTATAILGLLMMAGRLISPWLVGATADRFSLSLAMLIPGVALAISAVLAGTWRRLAGSE